MKKVLSVENMRRSDANCIAAGTPGRELMLRAAESLQNEIMSRLKEGLCKAPLAIVCGYGNNAGDGYALAHLLSDQGIDCSLVLLGDRFSEDGRYYYEICVNQGIKTFQFQDEISDLSPYPTVVDCIYGTGFRGEVKGRAREAILAINNSGAYVIAVDINSGLSGDGGMATSEEENLAVKADLCLSIGDFKPGHFLNMAKDFIKEKKNLDIGIEAAKPPYHLFEEGDLYKAFPKRKNYSNKSTYGYIGLIGGSIKYQGAIKLAFLSNAAMRSGAGVVRIGLPRTLYPYLAKNVLEATIFPLSDKEGEIAFVKEELDELIHNTKTLAFGMGVGLGKGARDCLKYLLQTYDKTLIVDADGLTLLSELEAEEIRRAKCNLVLSPHNKEFSRLCAKEIKDILLSPVDSVLSYLEKIRAYEVSKCRVLILKGPSSLISDGKNTYIVDAGCAGMATAGSGDVLAGILSALLVRAENPAYCSAAACFINGRAGELAEAKQGAVSMIASDTVREIGPVVKAAYETNRVCETE